MRLGRYFGETSWGRAVCYRGRGAAWTREGQGLRHSEGYAVPRGIPRSGAGQHRRRYPGRTNGGILRLLAQALNDVQELRCVPGCCRGRGSPRFLSFRGRRPWNPPVRGWAVRCRYSHATNQGIPAQSARMTAEFESTSSLLSRNQRWDSSVAYAPSE